MTWRLTHLVLLALAATAWLREGAPAAGAHASRLPCAQAEARPAEAHGSDLPCLELADAPADLDLCPEHRGRPRPEPPPHGAKAWPAAVPCAAEERAPGRSVRRRAGLANPSRPPLNVLLCTWLN